MEPSVHPGSIVILDFGGQYAHLIGSRIRRMGAFSEIRTAETTAAHLKGCAGIILSGGPQSVYEKGSPQADPDIFNLNVPVLGLCYGHQWLAHALGGKVGPGAVKEYGEAEMHLSEGDWAIFKGLPKKMTVWMSHGDTVESLPKGFTIAAHTKDCSIASFADEKRRLYGLQCHIEVTHTPQGMEMLKNFVSICKPAPWSIESYAAHVGDQILKEVGDRKVFMLVSGGVDSTVAFTLLNKVLGADRVQGLLVDTGLMRKDEVKLIQAAFKDLGIKNLHVEDASEEFFKNLKDAYEPEEKRKVIGNTFLDVQKRVSEHMDLAIEHGWMLGQGTIYPDTIETGGTKHADHIKTHHNRVEAVQKMMEKGLVIEPLKDLYKDEVRRLGEELGLPHDLVWRHPFPGPGLGVRILCAAKANSEVEYKDDIELKMIQDLFREKSGLVLPVKTVGVQGDGRTYRHAVGIFSGASLHDVTALATTIPNRMRQFNRVLLCTSQDFQPVFVFTPGTLTRERADLLRDADAVVDRVMRAHGLYEKIWQFPVVLLPFGTSENGQSVVLRPITSSDAMTASAYHLPDNVLQEMTLGIKALKNGSLHIDLVFIDLTNKPPATIEWE